MNGSYVYGVCLSFKVILWMSGQELNESKFLSEQINNQEDPTEEQIIEKAEELGISDLGLAREALTKELDAQWKPYLNRKGEVYYINLEQRKAYLDHPVDMEVAITDALNHHKKVPLFREFTIEQVSRSPHLIQQELSRHEREKGLNVVYEESDEESMRRETQQSVEESMGYSQLIELDRAEVEVFRMEGGREMRAQLAAYRTQKETEYTNLAKISKEAVEQSKKERLTQLAALTEQEISAKNEAAFQRNLQSTREQFQAKKDRLDDLHGKQLELAYKLSSSLQGREEEVRIFYRNKRHHAKQAIFRQTQAQIRNNRTLRARMDAEGATQQFSDEMARTINAKVNIRARLFENLERQNSEGRSKQAKKRYSIFNNDLFTTERPQDHKDYFHYITDKLKTSESFLQQRIMPTVSDLPRVAPSLFLRLSLRIL